MILKIKTINIYKLRLPFRLTFSHSLKKANSADNIIVEILTNSLKGYGESGPRPYVTGETQETALRDVPALALSKKFPWDMDNLHQVKDFIRSVSEGKSRNAALCALELALLDLLAKSKGFRLLGLFPTKHLSEKVCYGGVAPLGNQKIISKICIIFKDIGINTIRLKLGQDYEQNRQSMRTVWEVMGRDCDLRVDVNGAWNLELARQHLPLLISNNISMVEQPLLPQDSGWKGLGEIFKSQGIKLMADESVCSMEELEKIIEEGAIDSINIRISKCGGFLNSLKMINRIRDAGLGFQIGCQLGESGILSAAGRSLSLISPDAFYHDGSYDNMLLEKNITTQDVSFGKGGWAMPLDGTGLGVQIEHEALSRFSNSMVTISRP